MSFVIKDVELLEKYSNKKLFDGEPVYDIRHQHLPTSNIT